MSSKGWNKMEIVSSICYVFASVIGVIFLTMLIFYFVGGCFKMTKRVKGKVTDVYRHDPRTDLDAKGIEKDRGIYYTGHFTYEVDGVTYRKFGKIGPLSAMTRKISVWYDPNDSEKASPGRLTTIVTMTVMGLISLALLLFPTLYPIITGA